MEQILAKGVVIGLKNQEYGQPEIEIIWDRADWKKLFVGQQILVVPVEEDEQNV